MTDTDLANAAAEATESLEPVAAAAWRAAGARGRAGPGPRRRGAAPPAGRDPRRQRDPPLPGGRSRDGDGRAAGRGSAVEDEGPGFDPAHLDQVFDRFWRAPDAPSGGTGPRPRDRALDRRAPWRHDPGVEPRRRAAPAHGSRSASPPPDARPRGLRCRRCLPRFPDRPSRHRPLVRRDADRGVLRGIRAGARPRPRHDRRSPDVAGPRADARATARAPRHRPPGSRRLGRRRGPYSIGLSWTTSPRWPTRSPRRPAGRSTCSATRWAGGSRSARRSGRRRSGASSRTRARPGPRCVRRANATSSSRRSRADLARGDNDALLARFMTEAVGMPPADLAAFRADPIWPLRSAAAPTIVRELDAADAAPEVSMDALAGGPRPGPPGRRVRVAVLVPRGRRGPRRAARRRPARDHRGRPARRPSQPPGRAARARRGVPRRLSRPWHTRAMDLGLFGWIFVGLIAGSISGWFVGSRSVQGCLPTMIVGVVGGVHRRLARRRDGARPHRGAASAPSCSRPSGRSWSASSCARSNATERVPAPHHGARRSGYHRRA